MVYVYRTRSVRAYAFQTRSVKAYSFQTQSVKAYVYQTWSVKAFAFVALPYLPITHVSSHAVPDSTRPHAY
jgi:hypothetical protein